MGQVDQIWEEVILQRMELIFLQKNPNMREFSEKEEEEEEADSVSIFFSNQLQCLNVGCAAEFSFILLMICLCFTPNMLFFLYISGYILWLYKTE